VEPVTTRERAVVGATDWDQCSISSTPPAHTRCTALLNGGHRSPSVMPIDSPHESASGGNENSPGGALPRSLLAPITWRRHPSDEAPSPSQQNVAHACLFATPARPDPGAAADWCRRAVPGRNGGFGCSVIYHLAHGRLTRIQRLFGAETCSTPVLNHTRRVFRPSSDGVLATTTKICARSHSSRGCPRQALQAPMSFLHNNALLSAATVAADCKANSASLTWAPSIFGAAHFGR
jgi:hypothetical protein